MGLSLPKKRQFKQRQRKRHVGVGVDKRRINEEKETAGNAGAERE